MIVFGPIPSRRLGQSIGVNNIPPKVCPYSCIYCQLGRTDKMQTARQEFYKPEDIFSEAEIKVKQIEAQNKHADYFSFVPDGEPTIDKNLGAEIDILKPLGIKIAVITNASLLWMDDVKEDLMKADWVSLSVDAADENTWRKIDRPHGSLNYQKVIDGIIDFSKAFQGTLVTETMFVDGVNNQKKSIEGIAERLAAIQPDKAYLLVPTRPPAESNVKRASGENLKTAAELIHSRALIDVQCITGDEKEEGFFFTKNIADDLLSITSVHPVREDIIDQLLNKRNTDKSVITELVRQGKLQEFCYEGKKFYRKNIGNN